MNTKNIISTEYTLILYPRQNCYGENIKPIYQKYSDISDIKIKKEDYSIDYWLYEIKLTQIEMVVKHKRKIYSTFSTILDRARLNYSVRL